MLNSISMYGGVQENSHPIVAMWDLWSLFIFQVLLKYKIEPTEGSVLGKKVGLASFLLTFYFP